MAVLSEADRVALTNEIMRIWSSRYAATAGLLKSDIRAMVDATDAWQDSNQASFNQSLPVNVRGTLTTSLKNDAFQMVADMRYRRS